MKKTIILSAALVAGLAFASCKKARTCTCTTTETSVSVYTQNGTTVTNPAQTSSTTEVASIDDKLSKKETLRKYNCTSRNEEEVTVRNQGSGSNAYVSTTTDTRSIDCKIK